MTHTDPPPPRAPADEAGSHGDPLHNEGVAHEHSDVNVRAILAFAAGLAVVAIVASIAMWLLFGWFERQAAADDPPLSPLSVPAAEMPRSTAGSTTFGNAPGPQLLTNEYMALEKNRAAEMEWLANYGWVDQQAGVAHIPIDEAKKLLLQRGVPTRAGAPIAQTLGTRLPAYGESSGGRMITAPPPAPENPREQKPAAKPHEKGH
jgi:hypothetical protein